MGFGYYLRQKRVEKGMSIRQLAMYAGCSDSYLSMLERGRRGKRGPSPDFLKRLVVPLGVPFELLLEAAGYQFQLAETVERESVVALVRKTLGDSVDQFAERIGLKAAEVNSLEHCEVSVETLQVIFEKLLGHHRTYTPMQKRALRQVEEIFSEHPSPLSDKLLKLLALFLE